MSSNDVIININGNDGVHAKADADPQKNGSPKSLQPEKPKPATVAEYLQKQENKFKSESSFHTLHIRDDFQQILLEMKKSRLSILFFHNLTFQGTEGQLPDMWDATPKTAGLQFTLAPNSRDVMLVEAQQRLGEKDFAAPMYDGRTGGMMGGYVKMFKPLVNEDGEEASVLLDVSDWLLSFGQYTQMGQQRRASGGKLETLLLSVSAFPQNFLLRLSVQGPGGMPLKTENGAERLTQYWTAGFCMLPEKPMIPRPFDRRVGYFTTPVHVGGASTATSQEHMIWRWNVQRRGGHLLYCIDPAVPKAYHDTIKRAVEAWNVGFKAAGLAEPVMKCVAMGDSEWPEQYSRGDSRFIAIHMTESQIPVLGYGPSVVDFRSGEILSASILLGFRPFLEQVSQYSFDALDPMRERLGCGSRLPLVDADHPEVLRTVFKTVIHEVGHTLGLRHNFIAAEDGNSSVMEYCDPLDTTDPSNPQYGGYFMTGIGKYDIFAIRYGYTTLDESFGTRHPALLLLANGQSIGEDLDSTPRNPLFATDENVGGVDPRVQRWGSAARRFGRDKMDMAKKRRQELLARVESGTIYPETYSQLLSQLLSLTFQHVMYGVGFVAGAEIDARRVLAEPCSPLDTLELLRSVVDFLVGPTFRLTATESRHFLKRGGSNRLVYSLVPAEPLRQHSRFCKQLIDTLLQPQRLERLELQRMQSEAGSGALGTFELLTAVAYNPGHDCNSLLDPLHKDGLWTAEGLLESGKDPLRAEARLAFAEKVAQLQQKGTNAAVRASAEAFATNLRRQVKTAVKELLDTDVAAPWKLFARELKPKRQSAGAPSLPFMMFFDDQDNNSGPPIPSSCGCACQVCSIIDRRRNRLVFSEQARL